MIEFFFWVGVALTLHGYLGYGAFLWFLARRWGKPSSWRPHTPRLTLIVAAYNEEAVIAEKLENCLALNYPPESLEILVVADGSDDATVEIARKYPRVKVAYSPKREGKLAAVNRVVPLSEGEILVFSDANAFYHKDSLLRLAGHFHDPRVGAVAGEKRVVGEGIGSEEGFYWRYESTLKRWDSRLSSVMGAAGEIFALRRELYFPLPTDTVIEDFVLSMELVRKGYRVVYERDAIATEQASSSIREEWKRKTRIAAGGWQAVFRLWPLLIPTRPLIWFQYVSHRVLRWTIIPLLLPGLLLESLLLPGAIYRILFGAQVLFYGLAFLGYRKMRKGPSPKVLALPFYFAFFNLAALVGGTRFLLGWKPAIWEKARREKLG